MSANKKPMAPNLADEEIPDLSTPEWRKQFVKSKVRRGRPPAEMTKVSTTIRLDPDIVEAFRAGGEGWQSRINAALREYLEKRARS
jgi:uncharacterized protein (DUF4415 family)